jgi:ABC-type multidrug transport system fused ATPase/permease subunit
MYAIQAILEVSRTIVAAATCLYFLGALLKQVETRKRNPAPFIWLLLAILLVSVTEAAVMIVRAGGLPNIQPMAATLLYILGLLLQIDYLWDPTNEQEKSAWHAFLGSWTTMAMFDLLSIVEFAAVFHSLSVDLVCGAVATSLRFCLEIGLFIVFAWPDRGGFVRLTDNDVMGDTTVVSNRNNSGGGNRKKFLRRSIQDEIEAAGGTWPWVGKFRILLPWIWPSGMPWEMMLRIVVALLLRQVETALEVYTPYASGAFIETVARVYKDGDLIPVWKALGLLLVLHLANSEVGISTVRNLLLLSSTQLREMQAQNRIHAHLMDHEAAFHDVTSSIDIIDASDMGVRVCEALDSLFLQTVPQITQFIGTGITIFSLYGSHVALIGLTVTSIYALVSRRSNQMLMPIWDERITARQDTRRRREGGIKGWRTVVQHAQTDREIETHASSLSTYMKLAWQIQILNISSRFCLRLIVILGESAMMALVILREVQIGGTVGSVVVFGGYWSLLQSLLLFFIRIPESLIRDLYDADRLRRIMEVKPCMKYGSKDLHLAGGRIEFRDVTFGYTSSAKPVFKNLNLIIEPGTTTAIVGPSGIGKTSLLDLILRHYDPQKGSIEIDGQDVRTLRKGMYVDNDKNVESNTPTDV